MNNNPLIALPCKISPGAFSGERVIEIVLADKQTYVSVAPRYFCWNETGALVAENEPAAKNAAGMVAARLVEEIDDHRAAVEIPDGEVVAIEKSQIHKRPTQIAPPRALLTN